MSCPSTRTVEKGTAAEVQARRAANLWAVGALPPPKVDGLFVPKRLELREPDSMTVTERKLWNINPTDHEWRKQFFHGLPDYLVRYFANRYIDIYKKAGVRAANEFLVKRMGGELQRRIRLVLKRYKKLPTLKKVANLSEDAAAQLRESDEAYAAGILPAIVENPQQEMNFDSIKPRPQKEKLLAELERDELKEMAFRLGKLSKDKILSVVDTFPTGTKYHLIAKATYDELAGFAMSLGIAPPLKKTPNC
ncbi:hypothetical protein P4S70_01830 [Enterovibrio sp. Hal110]